MQQPQSPGRQALSMPPNVVPLSLRTDWDDDIAIGCECADPALQIERWGQDSTLQAQRDFS